MQGLSLWMLEDTIYNDLTGEIYTDRTWNYYIFGAKDIPHDFRVYFRRNAPNPVGILGSKGIITVVSLSLKKCVDQMGPFS